MSGLNHCTFIGYVGADPEMRYTANGKAVTSFRVGVSDRKDETEWVSVTCWEKLAENVGQHLLKGRQIYVSGRLQTRSYDDKDGVKRYRTEIVANNVTFLGPQNGSRESLEEIEPDDLPFTA